MTTATVESNQLSLSIHQTFKSELFQGKELRVLGTADRPYFVGKDIAEILGYKRERDAINQHVDKEDKIDWSVVENQGSGVTCCITGL